MARAYWINTFREIRDEAKVDAYVALAGPAIHAGGGRFLARGNPEAAFESGSTHRVALIEFDSVERAVATYEGPEYQAALKALDGGAVRDIRIIEAVSE